MYPRFSETFIVTELLSMEEQGVDIEIFSLRSPVDGRFHESLARVKAPVCYLDAGGKASEAWETLRRGRSALGSRLEQRARRAARGVPDRCLPGDRARRSPYGAAASPGSTPTSPRWRPRSPASPHDSPTCRTRSRSTPRTSSTRGSTKPSSGPSSRDAAAAVTVSDFNERYLKTRFGDSAKTGRPGLQRYRPRPVLDGASGEPAAGRGRGRAAGREEGLPPPARRDRVARAARDGRCVSSWWAGGSRKRI